ncbi:phosphotransferase family protein [Streptomyces sp. NP-1717]|uniref:phosphotransferase family protein n=1 Tax=Streptomyces sp. NP-1717 TaxID=2704470 RepID=UPI001F5D9D41|nr:aminoglycoside phosphotransferase family protein [Streptomyces sp. NP-1717]MCI3224730.1 aminoglycoside phosphotransferase family protein [Streptomyces sp. NP-1717]
MSALTASRLAAILRDAGARAGVDGFEALGGGTYNSLYRVRLDDGGRLVLKLLPEDGAPRLTYESELLLNEGEFYRSAEGVPVPVPEVVRLAGDSLLMTEVPGEPWSALANGIGDAEYERLRGELGSYVAQLHTVSGTRFGYPSEAVATAGSWREAFTAMLEAVLADAERFGAKLPVSGERVRELIRAAVPALDEVTVPALVHFDLWQGNVLLTGEAGERRIGGVIDGERMFWGDPLAEFASLNLFGEPEDDPALLAGYRAGGGDAGFDHSARLRMALYRCYLYLIMLVEGVPRAYPPARTAVTRRTAGTALILALGLISTTA